MRGVLKMWWMLGKKEGFLLMQDGDYEEGPRWMPDKQCRA